MIQNISSSRYKVWQSAVVTVFLVLPTLVCFYFGTGVSKTVHRADVLDDPTYWQPLLGRPSNTLVPPEDTTFNSKSYGSDNDHTNAAMVCRITKQHLFQVVQEEKEGSGSTYQQEANRLVCVSIVNDKEDDDFALDEYLSEKFYHRHKAEISHDDMFVSMTGIAVQRKSRTLTGNENTVINVVEAPREHERRMAGITKGNYTLAIVRVTTRDAQLVVSTQDLEEQVLSESDDAVNVITQFRAMSFGQFQLHSKGVYDVFIDQNISEFSTATSMLDTINEAVKQQFGVGHMRELADKVNICHPIGLAPFVAFTYRYAWRAHYSNHWCASLSATMHEMGHQIGLGHSHVVSPDSMDATCYMSHGNSGVVAPRQSFNGVKNLVLGWFEKRTLYLDPLASKARLVKLATFVDFNKTKVNQPVLLVIGETYVLQYNRAKGFNIGTRNLPNWVTVTVNVGFNATERRAALNLDKPLYTVTDYLGSGRDLLIQVCADVPGNDRRPDLMVISVGLGETLCNGASPSSLPTAPPSPRPTRAPSPRPTRSPTKVPTATPTKGPSATPHLRPSESPTASPSSSPRSSPSFSPKSSPDVSPSSPIPSWSPSASPVTGPESSPRPFPTSSPVSYSYMYVLSLFLVSVGAWQVFVLVY